jgi:hypothetical protein
MRQPRLGRCDWSPHAPGTGCAPGRRPGHPHYDWAMVEVASDDTPDGQDGGHSVPGSLESQKRLLRQGATVLKPTLALQEGFRGARVTDSD